MSDVLPVAIQIAVFVLMLVVGLDCTFAGLRRQTSRLGLVSTITLSQFTLVPLVAVATCRLLGLQGALAASILLLCCCPAATISNTYTFLSRGNTALSVTLTTVSCLLATVATPAALWTFGGLLEGPGGAWEVPVGPLVEQLVLLMALPIVLGLLVRRRYPGAVLRSLRALRAVSFALVLAILAMTALSVSGATLLAEIRSLWGPALLLTAMLFPLGLLVSRLFRVDCADRTALIFEFPCQNLAVVALVGVGVLGRPELVLFAAVCFVIQAVVLLGIVTFLARRAAAVETAPAG